MRFLAIFFFLLFTTPVEAGQFCDDDKLIFEQDFYLDFADSFRQDIGLPADYGGVIYPAKVILHLAGDGRAFLFGSYERPGKPNEVGFEYNLYRMELAIGVAAAADRQVIDQDYTRGCTSVTPGLFPGDHLDLIPIEIKPHADGTPRGREPVHLRFWGR